LATLTGEFGIDRTNLYSMLATPLSPTSAKTADHDDTAPAAL